MCSLPPDDSELCVVPVVVPVAPRGQGRGVGPFAFPVYDRTGRAVDIPGVGSGMGSGMGIGAVAGSGGASPRVHISCLGTWLVGWLVGWLVWIDEPACVG